MAGHIIGSAAYATRRAAASRTTKFLGGAALTIGWAAVALNAFGLLGNPMPMQQTATALSALIVVTLLAGLTWLIRGPGFYKSLKLGEAIGEQRERRRHRCQVAPSQRVGAAAG